MRPSGIVRRSHHAALALASDAGMAGSGRPSPAFGTLSPQAGRGEGFGLHAMRAWMQEGPASRGPCVG
jgi:hypothetical protein